MSHIAELVRAVCAEPRNDTPLLALADALDEAHPQGTDGRATVIRKAVASGYADRPDLTRSFHLHEHIHDVIPKTAGGSRHWIYTGIWRHEGDPLFHVQVGNDRGEIRSLFLPTSYTEAREIADTLPDSEDAHTGLDNHIGPDPRKANPEHFARKLNSAIKPTGDL